MDMGILNYKKELAQRPTPQELLCNSCWFSTTLWRNFLLCKKESCLQDSPPAAGRGSDILPLRRSAIIIFYYMGINNFVYAEMIALIHIAASTLAANRKYDKAAGI